MDRWCVRERGGSKKKKKNKKGKKKEEERRIKARKWSNFHSISCISVIPEKRMSSRPLIDLVVTDIYHTLFLLSVFVVV